MGPIFREMVKNPVMGSAVSALTMAWEKRYFSDDQWERLYFEFFYCCSFIWKYPIHVAAFLFCAPRLIRILLFFFPLLISTVLFLLVVFSLGPQLERMRIDRDLQWQRFREAAVCVEDSSGISCVCQQQMPQGVNSKLEEGADSWAKWTDSLDKLDSSIFYAEKLPAREENDKNVDFGETREEKVEEDGGEPMGVSGKSLILGRVRDVMERLIEELGGRVELDALNALENITQFLIESTGMDFQNHCMRTCSFDMIEEEYKLSDRTLCGGDSDLLSRQGTENTEILEHTSCENKGISWDDGSERKSPSILAMAEAELKQSYDRHLQETGNDVDSGQIESQNDVGFDHASGILKNKEDLSGSFIFASEEDELIDDVQFHRTGIVQNIDCKARKNVMSACSRQGNASTVSQDVEVKTMAPVLDKEQNSSGVCELPREKVRKCTSLPNGALKDEFAYMDELWEAHDVHGEEASVTGKIKELQKIHSNNCSRDQKEHSPSSSIQIAEHRNKHQSVVAAKLRNSVSEPITYLKKPQVLSSPVMLVGTAEMDLLWEKYHDASQGSLSARKDSKTEHARDFQDVLDSDAEDLREPSQVCCLQALKFSKGKMPLRKPSLKKISKALKKLGLMPHFRSRKTS